MINLFQSPNQLPLASQFPFQPNYYIQVTFPVQIQAHPIQYIPSNYFLYSPQTINSNIEIEKTKDASSEYEEPSSHNDNVINFSIIKKRKKNFFKCDYINCDKLYRTKENLILHYKNKHFYQKPFKCSYCDMMFSHRNGKTYHERRIHTFEFPYKCDISGCEKAFASKTALVYHKKKCHSI